ncbi:MAG: hypothetical protein QW607_05055 [Desulfurococcaceae archaeon]
MGDWRTNIDLVQKLYILYYGRPADPGGLKHWAEQLPDNAKPDSPEVKVLISKFINSEEARSRFGNPELKHTITRLILYGYQRDATDQEIAALKDKPVEEVIVLLLKPENKDDFLALEKKTVYANAFVRMLDPNEDGVANDGAAGRGFTVTYNGIRDAEVMASKILLINKKSKIDVEMVFKDIKQAIERPTDVIAKATKPEEVPAIAEAKVVEKINLEVARVEVLEKVVERLEDLKEVEKVIEKLKEIEDINKLKAIGEAIKRNETIDTVNEVINKIEEVAKSPTSPGDSVGGTGGGTGTGVGTGDTGGESGGVETGETGETEEQGGQEEAGTPKTFGLEIARIEIGSLKIIANENLASNISTNGIEIYENGTTKIEEEDLPESFNLDQSDPKIAILNVNFQNNFEWILFKYDGILGEIRNADGSRYLESINAVVGKPGGATIDLTANRALDKFNTNWRTYIFGGNGDDTIKISGGNLSSFDRPLVIYGGEGNDAIYLTNGTSSVDIIAFEENALNNGEDRIVGFLSNDRLNFALFLGSSYNVSEKVYDNDNNTDGIQHVDANGNGSINVSGKVVIANGIHDNLDQPSKIAGLFGPGKALSLSEGGKTVVITTQTDDGTFRIWFVYDENKDGSVADTEVGLVGVVTLGNDLTYGSGEDQFMFTINNFCFAYVF